MTTPIDQNFLEYLNKIISNEAEWLRENAALSGSRTDGGSQNVIDNLTLYLLGVKQEIPARYSLIYEEYRKTILIKERETDYNTYLKLKKIFE